jgi:acetolactate synthase small subunit
METPMEKSKQTTVPSDCKDLTVTSTVQQFSIVACHEPGTLSRVLGLFVQRNIELDVVIVKRKGHSRQVIGLETRALLENDARIIESKMEQIIGIEKVERVAIRN